MHSAPALDRWQREEAARYAREGRVPLVVEEGDIRAWRTDPPPGPLPASFPVLGRYVPPGWKVTRRMCFAYRPGERGYNAQTILEAFKQGFGYGIEEVGDGSLTLVEYQPD